MQEAGTDQGIVMGVAGPAGAGHRRRTVLPALLAADVAPPAPATGQYRTYTKKWTVERKRS